MPRRFLLLALAALLLAGPASSAGAATVPSGFSDQRFISGLNKPTALAFTPDGRLLVAEKQGRLRIAVNGQLRGTPALNLVAAICDEWERGLLGIAIDPAFTTNRYIYLYYTFNRARLTGDCPINAPTNRSNPVNRLSRFTLPDSNVIDPQSELVLLDNIPSPAGFHNAGDLHFAKDGYLYISIGDGGCDYALNSGCTSQNNAAQDLNALVGKILRIRSDGTAPDDNPFAGASSVACALTGTTAPGNTCREIYAYGLRNPFRFGFDPDAAGVRFFINEVGQERWEEVNLGEAGANYRWNRCEGPSLTDTAQSCPPPTGAERNAIYSYNHSTGCSSITGGAFVPRGIWPAAYDGAYLYGDYVCGKIFSLSASGGSYTATPFLTNLGANTATSIAFGPHQATQALYYASYVGGFIGRVSYTGTANRSPTAAAEATPTFGMPPLDVTFSAAGSSDPDGNPLSYSWAFGDGATGAGLTAAHRYAASGTYTATLTVSDGRGGSDSTSLRIDVGNSPPTPEILAPTAETRFSVGEVITLSGRAADAEDGQIPPERLTWEARLHHVDSSTPNTAHFHPYLEITPGNNLTITAPAPEDLGATELSYLEVIFTATDSNGLARSTTLNVYPKRVAVTFASQPPGMQLSVYGSTFAAPKTLVMWTGWRVPVVAARQQLGGTWYNLDFWSDGQPGSHTITAPGADITYTATFVEASQAPPDYVVRFPVILGQ